MNTDKTMVVKGFGGKNFPILNKGNQVARCEGEIGVPNRGPRAMKGWSQSWNIAKMQIVGESGLCDIGETFRSIFVVTLCLVRSNSWDAQLAIPNDLRYARLETNLGIGQAKEG
ncbi:hypothetical protein TNCV_1603851 [Trichonephila clavipes]|nr:hypothetical protein TNCV_1603851 [Trichonephila clavipes]